MDKFEEKNEEFKEICTALLEQFAKKNKHYGNDYFSGEYVDLERWMSIKRKVARLQSYYSGTSKESLPDETLDDTWKDLAIYSIMELMLREGGKNGKKNI